MGRTPCVLELCTLRLVRGFHAQDSCRVAIFRVLATCTAMSATGKGMARL